MGRKLISRLMNNFNAEILNAEAQGRRVRREVLEVSVE